MRLAKRAQADCGTNFNWLLLFLPGAELINCDFGRHRISQLASPTFVRFICSAGLLALLASFNVIVLFSTFSKLLLAQVEWPREWSYNKRVLCVSWLAGWLVDWTSDKG